MDEEETEELDGVFEVGVWVGSQGLKFGVVFGAWSQGEWEWLLDPVQC